MLRCRSVLLMDSGSAFQTVGAAEEKWRVPVLVRDLGTVSKSISADLNPWHGTYGCNVASR